VARASVPSSRPSNSPNVPYKVAHIARLIGTTKGRYTFRHFKVAKKATGGYLALIAAIDHEGSCPVVAFGSGETWGEAWEAANQAVGAGRWREDKYAGAGWANA